MGRNAVRNLFLCILPLLLALALAVRASAGEKKNGGKDAVMPEVVVEERAPRTEAETRNPSKFITVVDTEKADERIETVPEMLSETTSAHVRRYGGLGSYSTLSIRGASPNQVEVYLDGAPLGRAGSGATNISNLPLDSLERMEVYRGQIPAAFPTTNIGGAVNLVTRRPGPGLAGTLSFTAGSYQTYKVDAALSKGFEKWDGLLYFNRTSTEGDFDFLDDHGTPLNPDDDRIVERVNNDFASYDGLLKAGADLGRWRLEFLNDFFRREGGVPGYDYNQDDHARLNELRNLSALTLRNRGLLGGRLDLAFSGDFSYEVSEYDNSGGPSVYLGLPHNRDRTLAGGAGAVGTLFFDEISQALTVGLAGRAEAFLPANITDDGAEEGGPTQQRLGLNLSAQDEIGLLDGMVILQPALRYDLYRNDFSGAPGFGYGRSTSLENTTDFLSYSLGASARLLPWLTFKANAGRLYRVPTFYELFGNQGAVLGNPDLKPEKAVALDAGAEVLKEDAGPLDLLRFEGAFFARWSEDLIVFYQNSQNTSRPFNLDKTRILGFEGTLSAEALDHLSLAANYTFQDAVNTGPVPYHHGKEIPGLPSHELSLRPELFDRRWGRLYYTYDYIGSNYWDPANLLYVPARHIHGAGLTVYPWNDGKKRLALTFEVKNFTDNRIKDVARYPLPGRSYYGTVSCKF